ncbi:histidine phosphatase family protein [Mycolicibacillus trivialis]|uniref:histidine phosphatase family protein n=1 Tax=Mycolicibacillus trivialis TaxID=1798 RepID=UPI0021F2DF6C|nr:histidine phosphatase family protein [Mycolicibacillus trivialis]
MIQLLADTVVLDLIRHGESADNVAGILGTAAPGADLTDLGREQAVTIAEILKDIPGLNTVFASELVRTQDTAAPLVDALGTGAVLEILPGLNEIHAGLVNDLPAIPFAPFYILPPVAWALGFPLVPMLGSPDVNGFVFSDRFGEAIETIAEGGGHQVAFSHSAAIMFWTQMNVTNPDPTLLLTHQLSNTGIVELTGNPVDGWTLVNWDGVDVAADLNLWQSLFVDTRDLLIAPQAALWDLWQVLPGGDLTDILATAHTGLADTLHTTLGFPLAILDDVAGALPGLGGDLAALLPGDLGALIAAIATAF